MSDQSEPCVLLFDIDGTLIDSAGAGGGALLLALMQAFGVGQAQPVRLHGRTDFGIMTELLESHGVAANRQNLDRLSEHYFKLLPSELSNRPGRVLPGVCRLLDELEALAECHLGLLTGNMPTSARYKLHHYGLWERFAFGVFGHEAMHRTELSTPALDTVRSQVSDSLPTTSVIIVGDTPMDIELAHAMGARSLAVCTGGFAEETLREAGADKILADLSETDSIVRWCLQSTESQL